MASKSPSIKKPNFEAATKFAEGESKPARKKVAHKANTEAKTTSGQVPEGDVRLNANVRKSLHVRVKVEAAKQGTGHSSQWPLPLAWMQAFRIRWMTR